ncbi:MAG: signal peptidase I [Candidatus Tectomicrobia bacterium]|nr:signal peptidase I [Candidatus Tectomicrobia bacterium]
MAPEDVKNHALIAPRVPWRAGLLGLLLAGLGQVYNGQMKKGIVFHCLLQLSALAALLILFALPLAPVNVVGPLLMVLFVYLYILIDAIRIARRQDATYQRKAYNKWYIYLGIIVIMGYVIQPAMISALQDHLLQAFKMPSVSMENALLIGDHFLVNKFRYRLTSPQRFDVALIQYPWESQHQFVKRIIALPGDRIEVRDRQVYINDRSIEEPYARHDLRPRQTDFGPVVTPKKGDTIEIRQDRRVYLNGQPLSIPSGLFYPPPPGSAMTGFEVFYSSFFPPGTTLQKPTGPFTVQEDYYFTLGDNRDYSKDSRYWGFVPHANLRGTANTIYWSWDRAAKRVRWKRIGQAVQ